MYSTIPVAEVVAVTLVVVGMISLWLGLRRSVTGYQDEYGFHYGTKASPHSMHSANRLSPPKPARVPHIWIARRF